MTCEQALEALPDFALGTLSETETAALRRHLRGCAACRADAETLDQGLVMFASVAHEVEPPPELKERVMAVLEEEWAERPERPARKPMRAVPWLAVAAVAAALVGAVAWGANQSSSAHDARSALTGYQHDADSYRRFLDALGGRDVRVAPLQASGDSLVSGTAVFYDSDEGQSWVLVLARAPGMTGKANVALSTPDGRTIKMFPMMFDERGDGSSWLVTSADISDFNSVQLTGPSGVIAHGTASQRVTEPVSS
ncbi:MAG TPA: zf-HC2 domain-containing protein [Actinomycetota bacterium]|jgi:hypothetical protein